MDARRGTEETARFSGSGIEISGKSNEEEQIESDHKLTIEQMKSSKSMNFFFFFFCKLKKLKKHEFNFLQA